MILIPPSPGRVVWYYPHSTDREPLAAIVAKVWNDRMVNLMVIDGNGTPSSVTSVALLQEGDARPSGQHARWMPYQLGQAQAAAATR